MCTPDGGQVRLKHVVIRYNKLSVAFETVVTHMYKMQKYWSFVCLRLVIVKIYEFGVDLRLLYVDFKQGYDTMGRKYLYCHIF